MPTRAALRVIQNNNEHTQAGNVTLPSKEAAVMGAYQILADAMGASLEVTLDGQVVLYTGHFKDELHGVEDPKPPQGFRGRIVHAREPTFKDIMSEDYSAAVQLQWKKDADVEAHYSNLQSLAQ